MAVFLLSSLSFVGVGEAATSIWSRTYGGTDIDWAKSMVMTSDGGFAIAGRTESFGAGSADFWLVKTDEFGYMEWNRTYGGEGFEFAHSLIATSDGGYVLLGQTLLIKTDAYGNMEWNKTYDGSVLSVVQTSDGGYAVAGSLATGVNFDSICLETGEFVSTYDFWLFKTDAFGNVEWNQTYNGGTDYDYADSLVQTFDGGYALTGNTEPTAGAGVCDPWLVKTDAYGNLEWNQTYGGTGDDFADALLQTSDGGYAIAGSFVPSGTGYSDFWLFKTDAYGNMIWNQTYGGTQFDYATSLVATSDGGYAVAGGTYSFGAGKRDFWLIKTDTYGNAEWNQTYGGTEQELAYSLVVTPDGGYAIAGHTYSFGAGEDDFWLIKTDETGFVPEYSSLLLPSLLLTATLVIVIYKKKFFNGHPIES
jgi:hypothetical protein